MGKYRMEEPWGYQEERDYKSNTQEEVSIAGLFDKVEYNKGDNKMYFYDTYGKKCGTVDVSEFEEESIVDKAYYDKETQEIVIEFVNGDVVRINVKDVIDENEFKDGLQVNDGVVSILIDSAGEGYEGNPYLSTSENGLKISGIDKHIDDDVEAERVRAVAEEERIDAKLDAEITRATAEEARIDAKLDQEIADRIADVDEEEARAKAEESAANRRIDRLNDELDAEKTIREAADAALGRRIDQEIDDRISDVDAEEERAIAAEEALQTAIDNEAARATSAETALDEKIVAETERAISAETELSASIEEEAERATNAEAELDAKIDESVSSLTEAIESEISNRKAQAIHSAEYVKADNKIYFKNANDEAISEVDTTDFVVDGMVDDVKIENGNLVITFNTDAGKQDISIPLTEIFDPSNYYTKDDVDEKVATINDNISDEVSARESGDTALDGKIDALEAVVNTKANTTDVNAALDLKADKTEIPTDFYTKGEVDGKDNALQAAIDSNAEAISAESARAISAETDIEAALSGKADADVVYTQEEVDAFLAEKEEEITQIKKDYNTLKEIVGELGGNVEWGVPADGTFNNMMKKSGTVKLGEDITTSTYTGGITSKNETTLHLNGKNLTFSGSTTNNPGIMTRGEQKLTIMGKGTFDAAGRIAVETNGADTVINLSGTTGFFAAEPTYVTDRSGGELIYCYLGTINISAGVFKNNGADKTFMLNCYDANYRAGTAKIIVTGGKFYDFNPADNTAEGEHTSFVPEGYHVEESQDGDSTVYTVKKDA